MTCITVRLRYRTEMIVAMTNRIHVSTSLQRGRQKILKYFVFKLYIVDKQSKYEEVSWGPFICHSVFSFNAKK